MSERTFQPDKRRAWRDEAGHRWMAAGTVGGEAFATAVSQTAVAASLDATDLPFMGVRIEFEGDILTLICTDRYRLAIRELRWTPARSHLSAAVLVPAEALASAARSLTSAAEVSITLALPGRLRHRDEGMIGFEAGGSHTTIPLLTNEFPSFRLLLPSTVGATAEVSTSLLAEAVHRVAPVAEAGTAIRLGFIAGRLVLDTDEAQGYEVVEASLDGDDLTITLSPGYLLDGLAAVNSDTTRIALTGPLKPVLLTGKLGLDASPDYRYLLMPIRD